MGRVKVTPKTVLWIITFVAALAFWIWAAFFVVSQQPDSGINLSAIGGAVGLS